MRLTLEPAGYEVWPALSADEASRCIERLGLPHLALVDIMMPGKTGLEWCREVQEYCDLPVIMLTAVDEEDTMIEAIQHFAEDYVTKPFRPAVLVARVERVLRRIGDHSYAVAPEIVIDDRLALHFAKRTLRVDGEPLTMTPTECKILHILVRSAGKTVTTDYLLRRVWPLDEVFEDTLRVHVHRLRNKIEVNPKKPEYLKTKRGLGYRFQAR